MELQYGSMPAAETPTVEMRIGGRYFTHWGTSVMECIAVEPNEHPFLVRDTATGEERRYLGNGRVSRSFRTYMDLIEEVA